MAYPASYYLYNWLSSPFVGVELVGVSAAETSNPQKNIPSAINKIPVRILFFYVGAILVILCINPWTQLDASSSPFVEVFTLNRHSNRCRDYQFCCPDIRCICLQQWFIFNKPNALLH